MTRILVWDWPVRLGHWLRAGGFALAWLTAERESLRLVHIGAGGTVLAVAAFRLLWGLLGTRHARFGAFLRGPAAVRAYLLSLLGPRPEHHVGHNPAGGWAVVLLLGLAILAGASGWVANQDLGGDWVAELHEGLAATLLALVAVHIGGVVVSSLVHRENLIRAMVSGYKAGPPAAALPSARPVVAWLLLAWVVVVGWALVA